MSLLNETSPFLFCCSDVSQGGKEAASNAAEGAKSVVKSSQKEAEVAGTGTSNSSGRALYSAC